MGSEQDYFRVILRIMRILWEWEEKESEPMSVQMITLRYVATHVGGRGYLVVPRTLKSMAREGVVEEFSTQPNRWWHKLWRWLCPPNPLLLNPPPPDPTAHYRSLWTEEQFRRELPPEWFEEE